MTYLVNYAMSFVGTPYRWGGRHPHPMEGLDCSEYVQIILRAAGEDPPGDQTAQDLFDHFMKNGSPNRYSMGSLAFFGAAANKIIHVGFCVDSYRMLEAGGGGSDCTTVEKAIEKKAFVRMSLIKSRSDFFMVIKPRYSRIGLIS